MARTRKLGPDVTVKPFEDASGGGAPSNPLPRAWRENGVPFTGSLLKQNKADGFICISCAWAKPTDPRVFECCENGAKATTWEITNKRATPKFFADHSVSRLEQWDTIICRKAHPSVTLGRGQRQVCPG
jgi:hypothetical protein